MILELDLLDDISLPIHPYSPQPDMSMVIHSPIRFDETIRYFDTMVHVDLGKKKITSSQTSDEPFE